MATRVNLDYLKNNFGKDPVFMAEIVDIFLTEVPVRFRRLGELILSGEWEAAAKHAHSIKASVKMVGLDDLYKMVLDLEQAVNDEKLRPAMAAVYSHCALQLEEALVEISAYRKML